jgi:hypothetical protein
MDPLTIFQGYAGHKNRFFMPSFGTKTQGAERYATRRSLDTSKNMLNKFLLPIKATSQHSACLRKTKQEPHPLSLAVFMKTAGLSKQIDQNLERLSHKRKNYSLYRNKLFRRSMDAEIQNVSSNSIRFYDIQY